MELLKQKTKVREELITANIYAVNGEYEKDRAEKHRVIISNKLEGRAPRDKEAILLAGGAGADKSTIIKEYYLPEFNDDSISDFILIDSDQIKEKLDEYSEYKANEETVYYAAFYVHKESGHIVNLLLDECIKRGLSFIYDGTMSWKPHYDDLLLKLKSEGYTIAGVYVDVELEVAQRRARSRGEDEKRYVDPEFVELANRNSAITFRVLKPQFDQVLMFNNTNERTSDNDITPPFYIREFTFIEEFKNGKINDQSQLNLFIQKSELPYIEV